MIARVAALVTCALLWWFGFACTSSKQESNTGTNRPAGNIPPPPEPGEGAERVAPSHCRFLATVVAIDSSVTASGPCSQAPCIATVQVDSVVAYGSAFPRPLATGQLLRVRFTYTLSPTQPLFPGMKPGLPGLTPGARFRADLEGTSSPVSPPDSGVAYTIGEYKRE